MTKLVYLGPFLLALVLLIVNLIGSHDRTRAVEPAPFPAASADYLARLFRLRAIVSIALVGALVTYGAVSEDLVSMMKFSSPVFAIAVVAAIGGWLRARSALRLLATPDATVELFGDIVFVYAGEQTARLKATAWLVDRARHRGLPGSQVIDRP